MNSKHTAGTVINSKLIGANQNMKLVDVRDIDFAAMTINGTTVNTAEQLETALANVGGNTSDSELSNTVQNLQSALTTLQAQVAALPSSSNNGDILAMGERVITLSNSFLRVNRPNSDANHIDYAYKIDQLQFGFTNNVLSLTIALVNGEDPSDYFYDANINMTGFGDTDNVFAIQTGQSISNDQLTFTFRMVKDSNGSIVDATDNDLNNCEFEYIVLMKEKPLNNV